MSLLHSRSEGRRTKALEMQTAQFPSTTYLGLALTCMAASALLKARHRDHLALFLGQWPAPLLLMGVYNKLVKQLGSD